jgi:hypothetical protein
LDRSCSVATLITEITRRASAKFTLFHSLRLPAAATKVSPGEQWLHEVKFECWRMQLHKHLGSAAAFTTTMLAIWSRMQVLNRRIELLCRPTLICF